MNAYLWRNENGTNELLAVEDNEKLQVTSDAESTRIIRSKSVTNRETVSSYIKAGFDLLTREQFFLELDKLGARLKMPCDPDDDEKPAENEL